MPTPSSFPCPPRQQVAAAAVPARVPGATAGGAGQAPADAWPIPAGSMAQQAGATRRCLALAPALRQTEVPPLPPCTRRLRGWTSQPPGSCPYSPTTRDPAPPSARGAPTRVTAPPEARPTPRHASASGGRSKRRSGSSRAPVSSSRATHWVVGSRRCARTICSAPPSPSGMPSSGRAPRSVWSPSLAHACSTRPSSTSSP
mmetsp:Transcript_2506/g.8002  ORF Transcript_2506/g.8002 Transcript_2506/m.8002 type:complete len:201 (-) Transcript_2506:272-874(-)